MNLTANVRVILGDDPNTVEDAYEAEQVPLDNPDAICFVVAGMGHVIYANGRAMFTQGPGSEREVDVVDADDHVEVTVIKNGSGQRRMVLDIYGVDPS